jgi:hypothetical protein
VVPDHDILTIPFDLEDNFNALVSRMLNQNEMYAGGFVARGNEPLSTESLDSCQLKLVTGKKMKVNKRCEGAFDLEYSKLPKRNRIATLVEESKENDVALSFNANGNLFWTEVMELFDDFAEEKKTCPRYVTNLGRSLFKQDDILDW